MVSISQDEIADLYLIRAALEATAASLASQRMTDKEIAALGKLLERQMEAVRTAATPSQAPSAPQADAFHKAMYAGAKSPRLAAMLDQINAQVNQFRHLSLRVPGRATVSGAEHRQILEAIERHDPDAAANAVRDHLDRAHDALLKQIETANRQEQQRGE